MLPSRRINTASRGFSLIELLVVIVIITIVIAITVPAIGGARDLARAARTQTQIANLTTAVSAFQADEQRLPGFFTAQQMGQADTGFTSMQNLMLDLAGGPVADNGALPPNILLVGPTAGDEVNVNLNLIGVAESGGKNYYQPASNDYVTVEGKDDVAATDDVAQLPELVDAWGMPIMAWVEDEFAPDVPSEAAEIQDFARLNSTAEPARFYWQQNAGLLGSAGLGPRLTSQTESLLAEGVTNLPERLAALLGSTANPIAPNGELRSADVSELIPGSARGSVVFQSAGRDRVYLSTEDSGLRRLGGTFEYARYFSPGGSGTIGQNPWSDAEGSQGSKDILEDFNDIVQGVGG